MEQKDAAEVSESTPAILTPAIEAFALSLQAAAPEFVPVVDDPHGLYGWCSDGVLEKVKHDGGRCVFGWTIWEWPKVLLTAEFHAVWEEENGTLFDITPKPKGETRILFVADRSYPTDFDFDNRPRNRRQRLFIGGDPDAALAAMHAQLAGGKKTYEERRAAKAGLSLDQWLRAKIQPHPVAKLIDEFIDACDAFDEHFDSLGTAGTVAVDSKFEKLARRRLALQGQLKQEVKKIP